MGVEVVVNEDGSVTTRLVDEDGVQAPADAAEPEKEAEAKVVKAPAKAAPKARSTAQHK